MIPLWLETLRELQERQRTVLTLHPLLSRSYPVAITHSGQFYVFDTPDLATPYQLAAQAPLPMPIPTGVRAAFPLDFYGGQPACVVTGEVFDEPDGYATILHEFAHCYQWQTCEPALRQALAIAQRAQAAGDFMWEIHYSFPYTDPVFGQVYTAFFKILPDTPGEVVRSLRKQLKSILNPDDYDYLTWQEWKEGFARWLENRIRAAWGLDQILPSQETPISRVTFYTGGARYIQYLERQAPNLVKDLLQLYYQITKA